MSLYDDVWSNAEQQKKNGLIVGVVLILIFAATAFYFVLKVDYQTLFTDLNSQDASAIIDQLQQMKVDYKLDNAGEKILVSKDVVHDVRLKIMGSNLPIAGTVGFEIFNDTDFGMTEFAQKINFQRALQGELTRTIISLKEVKFARVHLVLPENGLFKKAAMKPSASVVLFVKNDSVLNKKQVTGIQQLVAASVPGMLPEHVTVTDQKGETLSAKYTSNSQAQSISKNLQIQKDVEDYYTEKINNLLKNNFDDKNFRVSVNVLLNYDQVKITRDGILNDKGKVGSAVIKEKESSYGVNGKSRKKRGGTKTKEVEYSLGRQIDQVIESPGRILKISVAVILPVNIEAHIQEQVKELIAMTIGLDEERGDGIAIYSSEITGLPSDDSNLTDEVTSLNEETASIQQTDVDSASMLNDVMPVGFIFKTSQIYAVLAILLFVIILLVFLLYGRSNNQKNSVIRLSDDEKEEVLQTIKNWLVEAELTKSDEVKS